jgi:SPP1 family predicted phage head-tail adaptor
MTAAGDLRWRVAFDQITEADSDLGGTAGDWEEQFSCRARLRYLKGSEPVIAQRLTGVQPVVITVRSSSLTRCVDASWRVRDERGTVFNIRSVTPDERRAWIDFLCDAGVA